jgi:hypothetical protein
MSITYRLCTCIETYDSETEDLEKRTELGTIFESHSLAEIEAAEELIGMVLPDQLDKTE